MPPRPFLFRLTPLVALACVACEGTLNLDIQADALDNDRQLSLKIDRVELVHNDGGVEGFDVDYTLTVGNSRRQPERLLDGETLRDGRYEAVRLRLVATDSQVKDEVSQEREVNLLDSTPETSNLSFSISEDETTDITLHLSSFASLPTDTSGSQDVNAKLSLVRNNSSAALSLTLDAPQALADLCANADDLPRLYLFSGSNPRVEDIRSGPSDVLRVLPASSVGDFPRQWGLSRVPLGSYRVALSCDDDNPGTAETVTFFCTTGINLTADRTVSLNTESGDPNCK